MKTIRKNNDNNRFWVVSGTKQGAFEKEGRTVSFLDLDPDLAFSANFNVPAGKNKSGKISEDKNDPCRNKSDRDGLAVEIEAWEAASDQSLLSCESWE